MEKHIITHHEYMTTNACDHDGFYAQFINRELVEYVTRNVGHNRIINSKDDAFNDIPLPLWDRLADNLCYFNALGRACNGGTALSQRVCLLKAVAKHIRDNARIEA